MRVLLLVLLASKLIGYGIRTVRGMLRHGPLFPNPTSTQDPAIGLSSFFLGAS
jgi:hypothetical protein